MAVSERRARAAEAIEVKNNLASAQIPFGIAEGGVVMIDSTSDGNDDTFEFYAMPSPSGTRYKLVDSAGSPIQIVCGPNECFAIPAELFGADSIMIVSTNGTCDGHYILKG